MPACMFPGARGEALPKGLALSLQYGHVLRSKIHNAGWCIYFKGGSAYFLAAGNRIYKCGDSGIAAGQGTGFEYMEPNWLQYEAYDIKVSSTPRPTLMPCSACLLHGRPRRSSGSADFLSAHLLHLALARGCRASECLLGTWHLTQFSFLSVLPIQLHGI